MKARTLVLGIGLPYVSDDALGFRVAAEIRKMNLPDVDVDEANVSGLDLIEIMIDYQRVIVVDAILTGNFPAGKVMVLGSESLPVTVHGVNPHEMNIGTTIALGKQLEPERFPSEIEFVAVEVNDVWTVNDVMTPEVEKALPEAVQTVVDLIEGREV